MAAAEWHRGPGGAPFVLDAGRYTASVVAGVGGFRILDRKGGTVAAYVRVQMNETVTAAECRVEFTLGERTTLIAEYTGDASTLSIERKAPLDAGSRG